MPLPPAVELQAWRELPRAGRWRRLRGLVADQRGRVDAMVRDGRANLGQRLVLRWVSKHMKADATAQCGVSK